MYLMPNEMVVPLTDLRYMSLDCKCGTSLTLDMALNVVVGAQAGMIPKYFEPDKCPVCKASLCSQEDIHQFRIAYQRLSGYDTPISFRVKSGSNEKIKPSDSPSAPVQSGTNAL